MTDSRPVYRDTFWWHTKLNLLWFAQSWKWFILLGAILPGEVERYVPGGEKSAAWGMILAAGALWATIGPVLFGSWSDRLGRRRPFVIWGTILTVGSMICLLNANSLFTVAAAFFLLQISDDIFQGAYSSLLPLLVPREGQSRSSSILAALNQGAQIVGAVASIAIGIIWADGTLLGLNGTQAVYAVLILAHLVCLMAVLSALKHLKEPFAAKPGKIETTFSVIRQLGRTGDFKWVWLSRLLVTLGYWLIQPFLLYFLSDAVARPAEGEELRLSAFGAKLSPDQGLYALALLISLMAAATALLLSRRLEKIGLKRAMMVSGWIMAALLIPFAFMRDYSVILVLGAIFGVGYGLYYASSWAIAVEVMPSKEDLGRDMGVWQSAVTLPQLSPALTGVIIGAINVGSQHMVSGPTGEGVLGYMVGIFGAAVLMVSGCRIAQRVTGVN